MVKKIIILMLSALCFGNVRIVTFHFNKPKFIELQKKTFDKFIVNRYEMIVFNDANEEQYASSIENTCDRLNIKHVRFQNDWHKDNPYNAYLTQHLTDPAVFSHIGNDVTQLDRHPSFRHSRALQYALDHYGYDFDGILVIMDGDAFLNRKINFNKLLEKEEIVGIKRIIEQDTVRYAWVPFIACDMRKIPNKHTFKVGAGRIGNTFYDTGAQTYHYFAENPSVKYSLIQGYSSTQLRDKPLARIRRHGFRKNEIALIQTLPWPECVEFHINQKVLHYAGSSFEDRNHKTKEDHVVKYLTNLTK